MDTLVARKIQARTTKEYIDHVCQQGVCFPISDSNGLVFLCDFGAIHVCKVDGPCSLVDDFGICPISGASHLNAGLTSSYSRSDNRTWHKSAPVETAVPRDGHYYYNWRLGQVLPIPTHASNHETRKKARYRVIADDAIRGIISNLLYGPGRHTINQKNLGDATAAINTYRKTCQREATPVNLPHIQTILDSCQAASLPIEPYVLERVAHYTGIVKHVLGLVDRFVNDPPTVDCIVLATLYRMSRCGFVLDDVELLPSDGYLAYMLPRTRALHLFDMDKKSISRGNEALQRAYSAAQLQRVPLRSLCPVIDITPDDDRYAVIPVNPSNRTKNDYAT